MEVNYIKLGVTMFLALTLSSLAVDGVRAYFASQVMIEASKQLKIYNKKNKDELFKKNQKNKRIAKAQEKTRQNKIISQRNEYQKLKSIRKTNNETCSFWTKKYSEGKSEYRQQMKISACNRARND